MRSTGGTVGSASTEERSDGVSIRPLEERDLSAADRVYRLAFGMQFGLPDPMQYRGDAQVLRPRWATTPGATFVAELDGESWAASPGWTGAACSCWGRSRFIPIIGVRALRACSFRPSSAKPIRWAGT